MRENVRTKTIIEGKEATEGRALLNISPRGITLVVEAHIMREDLTAEIVSVAVDINQEKEAPQST